MRIVQWWKWRLQVRSLNRDVSYAYRLWRASSDEYSDAWVVYDDRPDLWEVTKEIMDRVTANHDEYTRLRMSLERLERAHP
jgi:hypothetical protein